MLTWLANLLSGGRLDRIERRVEELERERDYAWGEFRAESERTEWQAEQHLRWRELHHRAVQLRDMAGQDLARLTRELQLTKNQRHLWKNDARRYSRNADFWAERGNDTDRSRRGWRWLYEAKCAEWVRAVEAAKEWELRELETDEYAELLATKLDDTEKALTEARGLRDGWEQTAGELQAQVQQGDNNLQRVEAERDEAIQAVDHLREDRDRLQRRVDLQHATIERLEAQVRQYQAQLTNVGLERDPETGRFLSRD